MAKLAWQQPDPSLRLLGSYGVTDDPVVNIPQLPQPGSERCRSPACAATCHVAYGGGASWRSSLASGRHILATKLEQCWKDFDRLRLEYLIKAMLDHGSREAGHPRG